MPRNGDLDENNEPGGSRPEDTEGRDLSRLDSFLSEEGLPEAGAEASPEPAPKPSSNNLSGDSYDKRLFSELAEVSGELSTLLDTRSGQAPPTFGPLVEDFFRAFYKVSPTFTDEETVKQQARSVNRPLVERLLEDERTALTRVSACLDELSSGLATLEAGKKALEELKERPDLREWMRRAAAPDSADPDDPNQPENEAAASAGEDPRAPENACPPPARAMRRMVREAVSAGRREAEEVRGALAGWGLGPGDMREVPLGERLELARRLRTPKMRRLADLVGRMKKLAGATGREKVRPSRDEVHSVTLGADIERVLPAELASGMASAHPLRKLDFTRRLLEGSLFCYELEGTDRLARGPVIAAIDCSSSMRGAPMEWASAVALTLASVAAREGRFAHLIYFNTRIVREVYLDASRQAPLDPRKVLEAANVGADGGTAYEPPVRRAIEVMAQAHSGAAAKADVLMVTDGLCELSEEAVSELRAARGRRDFKLVSVLIGENALSGGAGSSPSASPQEFSDAVVPLAGITGGPDGAAQARAVFESF